MSVIDEILWLLRDGKWHDLKEVGEYVSLSEAKLSIAINFIGEYMFAQLNEDRKKIRLQTSILEFINKIQSLEKEETLSHKAF